MALDTSEVTLTVDRSIMASLNMRGVKEEKRGVNGTRLERIAVACIYSSGGGEGGKGVGKEMTDITVHGIDRYHCL